MVDTHLSRAMLLDRGRERDVAGSTHRGNTRGPAVACWSFAARRGSARPRCSGYLSAAAEGCRIARAAGVESEMELAFAGLHALCAPMLGRLGRLPSPAARRAEHGVRHERRSPAGSLPGRPGRPQPAGRRRRGAAARLHRRRRAVARSNVRADARVRGATPSGGAGGTGVRAARVRRRARARRTAGARDRGPGRRRRPPAAGRDDPRAARRTGAAPDPRRGRRQPARAARADARGQAARGRGRIRAARGGAAEQPHRAGLRAPAGAAPGRDPAPAPAGGGGAARRRAAAVARGRAASASGARRRERPRRQAWSRSARACGSAIRSSVRPPTGPRPHPSDARSIARSPTRPTRGSTRIAGRGTALARPTGPTRPWPASWSARPTGRRAVAGCRRPRHSCSGPSS